jgi:hypothetical protein
MANTDRAEWRLYDTNLTTQLCILPVAAGHLILRLNETGSGEIHVPLDSIAATLIANGKFGGLFYRGAFRGGFFIDNSKEIHVGNEEGGGRGLSVSGLGLLSYLRRPIIYSDGTNNSTRSFQDTNKATILDTLFNEALTRGGFTLLDWDFSTTQGSDSVAWTDNVSLELNVGMSYLEVIQQFAKAGDIEFSATLQAGSQPVLISAYAGGIGSDKSETIYFRVGSNIQEISDDERGDEVINAYLVKYRDGYTQVSDSASVAARGRHEDILNLEVAQSSESALTFASAKLAITKDPRNSIDVKAYDGIKPYLFVDYILGDTITLDRFGVENTYRVLGVQMDFSGDDYAEVTVDFNDIFYDSDLRMSNDLDWLLKQWNTARDANQLEARQWMDFGQPNGEIYALLNDGDYLYVGGDFTAITGKITASYIARYQISTGQWSSMGTTITSKVKALAVDSGGIIYAATATKIYEWNDPVWVLDGTAGGGSAEIYSLYTDGTDLYVTGFSIVSIDGVTMSSNVGMWDGFTWTAKGTNACGTCYQVVVFAGSLYGAFLGPTNKGINKLIGSTWTAVFSSGTSAAYAIISVNDTIYFIYSGSLNSWDGVASLPTKISDIFSGGGIVGDKFSIASYLSDIYVVGIEALESGGTDYNNILKYSGGLFSVLGGGLPMVGGQEARAIAIAGQDVYVGGLFPTAGDKTINNLAVWVTDFQSIVNHLSHDSQFDLASAIHQATASAITDNDEMGFWEDVSNALRKITWANIKATLKTYFDAIYAPIAKGVTNGDSHNHVGGDGNTIDYLSLSNRPLAEVQANDIYRVDAPGGSSAWTGTINGTPSGASVVYNLGTGTPASMVPTSTSQLGKMRLYNTTRGTSALISNVNTGTKTITLTANAPAGWANGDALTIASQTVSGGGVSWVDIEITSGPINKLYMFMRLHIASATAGDVTWLHPFETYSITKTTQLDVQVANAGITYRYMDLVKITSNVFALTWTGTPAKVIVREAGYLE